LAAIALARSGVGDRDAETELGPLRDRQRIGRGLALIGELSVERVHLDEEALHPRFSSLKKSFPLSSITLFFPLPACGERVASGAAASRVRGISWQAPRRPLTRRAPRVDLSPQGGEKVKTRELSQIQLLEKVVPLVVDHSFFPLPACGERVASGAAASRVRGISWQAPRRLLTRRAPRVD